MTELSETVDNDVLRLRSEGRAYARISRDLGLTRAADAQKAFRRALRRLPAGDAERVRGEELSRLDRLADRVRADATRDELEQARKLQTIERLMGQLRADG